MGITRRDWIEAIAVGSASLAIGACNDGRPPGDDGADASSDPPKPVTPPESTPEVARFPLGVSAGDLAGGSGVIWAQYTGTASLAAFAWRVAGDDYVEELGPFAATPGDGGFTHVAIAGLQAGARYRYAFFEMDGSETGTRTGRSLIGKFRAPIADGASEVITLGAISCTDSGRAADPIARAAERTDLDGFLFVGDNAYCEATDVAKFRTDYAEHFGRPAHVSLRAANGMLATWDDHEVANNWNPETIDSAHVAAAFTAFFDHAPYARDASAPNKIWRSQKWGNTVEVFVLDARSERKPSTRGSATAQYLSPAQLAWLKAGLSASTAVFKVIINSVPITNMPSVWDLQQVDRWEGYAAQRTDILSFIDGNAITGVLWLAGDFHLAFISTVGTAGQPGANQREVLCGPGGQSGNPLVSSLQQPQFSFATTTNNFTTLRFDPATREVVVAYIDGGGNTFHTEAFVP